MAIYHACSEDRDCRLEPVRPYRDYISWLQGQDLAEAEGFWRGELKGFAAPTPLLGSPAHGKDEDQDYEPAELLGNSPPLLTAELRAFASRHGLTLSTIVQGAWAILLSRYSGEEDIVFGSTVSGRPAELAGVELMAGLFINSLPVRAQFSPQDTTLAWLKDFQDKLVELRQYEHTPLVEVQGWSEVGRDQQLFESLLAFENYPVDASAWGRDGTIQISNMRVIGPINYALGVVVVPKDEFTIRVSYDPHRFDAATVSRMLAHFNTLLEGIVANPDGRLSDLPLLTEAERQQVLYEWNDTQADFPRDKPVHELFEAQAARAPDAVAVVHQDRELSYGELNARANYLARHLRELGVTPDTRVAIGLERSIELVLAELAILKCGAAYVPLDQNAPIQRMSFMIEDCQARVVVTTKGRVVPEVPGVSRVDVDELTLKGEISDIPAAPGDSEAAAYVMYTSGSTGKPKGVEIPHRAIGRLVLNNGYANFQASDRIAFASNPAFDAATMEVWGALLNGGSIVVIDQATLLEPHSFAYALETNSVTTLFITTALFNRYAVIIPEVLARLRFLLCGGEQSEPSSFARVRQHAGPQHLIHCYGPTETTTFAATFEVKDVPPGARSVPIGGPISNTQIYILDRQGELVPIGVVGEIHIGGLGVARGYLNRPTLTAERFVTDPFAETAGASMYKSGDLGRYLPDGNIEFVGRNDFQVKIRGFRIELGEIEARLAEHPAVGEAVVLAREDEPGERRLVAYLTVKEGETPKDFGNARPASGEAARLHDAFGVRRPGPPPADAEREGGSQGLAEAGPEIIEPGCIRTARHREGEGFSDHLVATVAS